MIPPIFKILKNTATVTAIIGTAPVRVYPWGEAPQNVARPYATWMIFDGSPENYLNQTPDIDKVGIQMDCWAEKGADCEALAIAIRDALEPHGHMTNFANMERDPETKLYRLRMDFDIYNRR